MVTFPGESDSYRAARNRLLEQEVELRRLTEAVAASRRALPPGGTVPENYVFDGVGPNGALTKITLADLFEPGKDTLFVYNMMFPRSPDEDLACPSCTQFLDSFDGVAEHAGQRINVAVVVKTALPNALAHAEPDPGQDQRHGDTIDPLWNLFDLTPEGRGEDWYPALSY